MALGVVIDYVLLFVGPLFISSIDLLVPATMPFTNSSTTLGYATNFALQNFIILESASFLFSLISILIISVGHLFIEMKVLKIIASNVGKHEERIFLKKFNEDDVDAIEQIDIEETFESSELIKLIHSMHIEIIE